MLSLLCPNDVTTAVHLVLPQLGAKDHTLQSKGTLHSLSKSSVSAVLLQVPLFNFVALQFPSMQVFLGVDALVPQPIGGQCWGTGLAVGCFPLENMLLPVIQFSWPPSLVNRSGGEASGWSTVWVSVRDGEVALTGHGHGATFLAEGIFHP